MRTCAILCATALLTAAELPTSVNIAIKARPLIDLVDRLARACDAGLLVQARVVDRLGVVATYEFNDAAWMDVADILAKDHRLLVRLNRDRLEVDDLDADLRARLVQRSYPIRMLFGLPAEQRDTINLSLPDPGGIGSRLLPPIVPAEPLNTVGLSELIRASVKPGEWPEVTSVGEYDADRTLVTQTPDMQGQVAEWLTATERKHAVMVQITLVALSRDPGATVLDAAAWQLASAGAGAPLGVIVVPDRGMNFHWSGTRRHVLMDVDRIQGVYDPIMTVIADGLRVSASPAITVAGVRLDAVLQLVDGQKLGERAVTTADGTPLLTLTTVERAESRVADTRLVPPGGAAVYRLGERVIAAAVQVVRLAP